MLESEAKPATMEISAPKSKFMEVQRHVRIGTTTEEDVQLLGYRVSCIHCGRPFKGMASVRAHINARYCPALENCRLREWVYSTAVHHDTAIEVDSVVEKETRKRKIATYPNVAIKRCKLGRFKVPSRRGQIADLDVRRMKLEAMASKDIRKLTVAGGEIGRVFTCKYLGSTIAADGDDTIDMENRISKGFNAMYQLKHIWKDNRLSKKLKCRLFNTYVVAVILYGSETWHLQRAVVRRHLAKFERRAARFIGVTDKMLGLQRQYDVRKHRWIGHLLRQSPETLLHQSLYLPCTYHMFIEEYVQPGIDMEEAVQRAQDRCRWKERERQIQAGCESGCVWRKRSCAELHS